MCLFPEFTVLNGRKPSVYIVSARGVDRRVKGPPNVSRIKKVYFQKNAESRFAGVAVLECVTPDGYPFFSIVLKQCTGQSWGLLKGAVTAQKALQGPETETRELLEESKQKVLLRWGVIELPSMVFTRLAPYPLIFDSLRPSWLCLHCTTVQLIHIQFPITENKLLINAFRSLFPFCCMLWILSIKILQLCSWGI